MKANNDEPSTEQKSPHAQTHAHTHSHTPVTPSSRQCCNTGAPALSIRRWPVPFFPFPVEHPCGPTLKKVILWGCFFFQTDKGRFRAAKAANKTPMSRAAKAAKKTPMPGQANITGFFKGGSNRCAVHACDLCQLFPLCVQSALVYFSPQCLFMRGVSLHNVCVDEQAS